MKDQLQDLNESIESTLERFKTYPVNHAALLVSTGIGAGVGAFVVSATIPAMAAGAVIGLALGWNKSDSIADSIKEKFKSAKATLDRIEISKSIDAMKELTGISDDQEARQLLDITRSELSAPNARFSKHKHSKYSPKIAAKLLLGKLRGKTL
jgi:hypothetical protein